jgi:heptosyltransferase I
MKIAIVKTSALGDIIHAMVVLQFIKHLIKDVDIDWIVEERYKSLLESHPDINIVHTVNIKEAKEKKSLSLLIMQLIKVRKFGVYDIVIDMQGLIKSAVLSRIIRSRTTFGFDKTSIREGAAAIFYSNTLTVDYAENIINRNIAIVSKALELSINEIDLINKKPFLYSTKKYLLSSGFDGKKNIALIPGASFQSKCYPIDKFAELTKMIDANFFVIWGSENEKIMAKELKSLSTEINIVEKLSLGELISFISQMSLIIGSDTGPTHMAWSLNIPSITLFGPTPGYRNTFETDINKYIDSKSIVNPLNINKNDHSIKDIKLEDIVKMTRYLLKVN